MSGFATHRQRVHDVRLTPRARHANLRTCVVMFAPYGFRATYHHLCVSAGVPGDLAADPLPLVRAAEELGAARQLWLADEAAYVALRRREKAARRRYVPDDHHRPARRRGPGGSLALCPDPGFHPGGPLPAVVARLLAAEPSSACPACDGRVGTTRWFTGHEEHDLCARCGITLGARPAGPDARVARERHERWLAVWWRTG
ncbi:hypothetical protein ACFXPM_08410 [Streptomyces sp. NPDC059095]|uniref:hypothetical protein n=1 Tax=Streptomyces sp. NPDC059095 TaxID=3346726 RepID=UPI003685C69F